MIRLKLIIACAAQLFACTLYAQPPQWSPIDNVDDAYGSYDLYYSENLDLTIFCGIFRSLEDERYLAGFNGNQWIRLTDTCDSAIQTAVDFEGGILVGGYLNYIETQNMPGIAKFDGNEWSFPWAFDQSITKLKWVNDTLFSLGFFSTIDGDSISQVARLVDGSWESVCQFPDSLEWVNIRDIEYFQGSYYIAGKFVFENSLIGLVKIENGTIVEATDQLKTGPWHGVRDLNVFQNDLYISGSLPVSLGNPGNHLMRWDGETLRDVDCNIFEFPQNLAYGGIKMVRVIGDYLYAGGLFRYCDDLELYEIGRWDGNQWCSLHTINFDQPELEFEHRLVLLGHFQNQLMQTRVFYYEDDSFDEFWLYEEGNLTENCSEPLSIRQDGQTIFFDIYPNPSSTFTTIQSTAIIQELILRNSLGQMIRRLQPFSEKLALDLAGLASGIYLVEVITEEGRGVQKLLIE